MLLHLHLALIPYVLAAPTRRTAITDGAAVGQTYDYVIAGGGLAGVVLAARLSEDTSKTALVIEAGHDESNNDIVTRLQTVFEIQRDWILNRSAGITENYDYSYDTTMGWDSWFLLPFGRGSVRIMDEDAFGSFNIDPRYFENEFDALASGASARFTRTASNTSPLAGHVTSERDPGSGTGDSLDDWTAWAKDNYRSNWHPIGTVAMMSQELGGCVDSRHRVYGVQGLRVVDGSNLPFQVSSHLMSVLYGLAERAAQLIAEDNAGTNGT
ncbi:hypothetical protein CspHIS471_0402690 [Cutaneotrichosporon sp. HIS471]|nr:hypothetical protein CspHIS471_0402690 [Cutaneotrichosporon sp. HIS471]